MRLIAMTMEEDGDLGVVPKTITVEMDRDEAAVIVSMFGKMNGWAYDRLGLSQGSPSGPYECLSGGVFNRYYDGGVRDVLPDFGSLADLNEVFVP